MALFEARASAVVLASPSISGASSPFPGYPWSYVFDGTYAEAASNNAGDATFMELDFGTEVTFDRVVMINRASIGAGDHPTQVTLTYANGSLQTVGSDTIATDSSLGQGLIYATSDVSTRYVRWDVDSRDGITVANPGLMEMYFLETPSGSEVVGSVTVFNAATAFGGYSMTGAANGSLGWTTAASSYASAYQGANMFVDFDLGATVPITGFDYFDRLSPTDRVLGFDLIFSDDPTFATTVGTLSYSKGMASAFSDEFESIDARYVRLDATSVYGGSGATYNAGINEMIFYAQAVPEPSTSLLTLGYLAGALARRRR